MDRNELVRKYIRRDDAVLEIGPLNRPVAKKDEYPYVRYCDIRSTEEIKALYSGNAYLEKTGLHVETDTIVEINHVLRGTYRDTFCHGEKFDVFVACHVIEHIPDILGFFADITNVLKPGARLLVAYPDRRYCFDHFRFCTPFRDAYDVHAGGSARAARLAMDFYYGAIRVNDPVLFWTEENMSQLFPAADFADARRRYEEASGGAMPADAHYWIFDDAEFLYFLYDATRAGMLPFICEAFYPTELGTQEYYAVLRYVPEIPEAPESALEEIKRLIDAQESTAQSEVIELRKAIFQGENTIEDMRRILQDKEVRINELEATLCVALDRLRSMENSKSWQYTAPLRRLKKRLRRKK